jgi:hypothetical protein
MNKMRLESPWGQRKPIFVIVKCPLDMTAADAHLCFEKVDQRVIAD